MAAQLVTKRAAVPFARSGFRPRRVAVWLITVALAVVGHAAFAPLSIGGSVSYVITDGTSMLPGIHADGLVLTRARDDYRVGEVVAYHNPMLGKVVLHRIVAMDGDRYVFQGDNNDYADRYHAARADLVGQEWIYWPDGGTVFRVLRNPAVFAVIVGVIALLAFRAPRRSRRRRRHHHQR